MAKTAPKSKSAAKGPAQTAGAAGEQAEDKEKPKYIE